MYRTPYDLQEQRNEIGNEVFGYLQKPPSCKCTKITPLKFKKRKKKKHQPPQVPEELYPTYEPCVHLHFKQDLIDRECLTHNQHLDMLATPKGYRWMGEFDCDNPELDINNKKKRRKPRRREPQEVKLDAGDFADEFVEDMWDVMTPEITDRLIDFLVNEFGMSVQEAEDFVDCKSVAGKQTVCRKKKSKTMVGFGPKHKWVKEFSNVFAKRVEQYIVSMLLTRRTPRGKRIAERILEFLCDLTGEKTTLHNPKTKVQRTMVLISDRLALWIDDLMKDIDKPSKARPSITEEEIPESEEEEEEKEAEDEGKKEEPVKKEPIVKKENKYEEEAAQDGDKAAEEEKPADKESEPDEKPEPEPEQEQLQEKERPQPKEEEAEPEPELVTESPQDEPQQEKEPERPPPPSEVEEEAKREAQQPEAVTEVTAQEAAEVAEGEEKPSEEAEEGEKVESVAEEEADKETALEEEPVIEGKPAIEEEAEIEEKTAIEEEPEIGEEPEIEEEPAIEEKGQPEGEREAVPAKEKPAEEEPREKIPTEKPKEEEQAKKPYTDIFDIIKEDIAGAPKGKRTDRQTEIKDVVDRRIEKIMGKDILGEVPSEDIDDAASRVAHWVELIMGATETKKDAIRRKRTSVGGAFQVRPKSGSTLEVQKLSSGTVVEATALARGLQPPPRGRKIPASVSPMNVQSAQEWMEWATNIGTVAEEWDNWLESKVTDAEKHLVDKKKETVETDWRQWKDQAQHEAVKWRVEKERIRDEGKVWNKKINEKLKQQPEQEVRSTELEVEEQ